MPLSNPEAVALRVIEFTAILLPVIAIMMQISVRYYLSESFDLSYPSKILIFVSGAIAISLFAIGAGGSGWYLLQQGYGQLVGISIQAILGGIGLIALLGVVLLGRLVWGTTEDKANTENQVDRNESQQEEDNG